MNAVQPPFQLAEAPGSRAAFHLGLWSLLLNLCCGCFPVAVPLGIAAIAKYNRAKREAACAPDQYAQPPATGMVLGIVGLCCTFFALMWIAIYSAIAVPALLGQRARARDKAADRGDELDPDLKALQELFIERFGTKVQIRGDMNGGSIEIEYYSADDLQRILDTVSAGA